MDSITSSLGAAFAAAAAAQRLNELLDSPAIVRIAGTRIVQRLGGEESGKRFVMNLASLVWGVLAAAVLKPHLLIILGAPSSRGLGVLDFLTSALIISGGTEAFNSVLKFAEHAKDRLKPEARVLGDLQGR